MTIVAAAETAGYTARPRLDKFWWRLIIAAAFLVSDAACFAVADILLHQFSSPPSLAIFRGNVLGRTGSAIDLIVILGVIFTAARYIAGDYSRRQLFWDGARATTGSLFLFSFIYLGAALLLEPGGLLAPAAIMFLLIIAVPSARQLTRLLLAKLGLWYQPTAIIGSSATACEVCPVLDKQLSLGLDVRWIVPDTYDLVLPPPLSGLTPIRVAPDQLAGALIALGCRQVILASDDNLAIDQKLLIDQMVGSDITVSVMPPLRRLPLFGMSTSFFFGKDFLLLQMRNNLARLPQRILKRTMDVAGGLISLTLLLPLFAVIAVLIKREDGGPVFFIQDRVGLNGAVFRCWKFRTMAVDAEAQMARWAKENPGLLADYRASNFKLREDPRVTRIGAWMRSKSIDELPQLINIVFGKMSLVGPRPILERELPDYGSNITLYTRVRPGLTGLWQISGRSHTTFAERVSYDEWYIKNWNVWYDVVIILQTVWVLLRGIGAF